MTFVSNFIPNFIVSFVENSGVGPTRFTTRLTTKGDGCSKSWPGEAKHLMTEVVKVFSE